MLCITRKALHVHTTKTPSVNIIVGRTRTDNTIAPLHNIHVCKTVGTEDEQLLETRTKENTISLPFQNSPHSQRSFDEDYRTAL